jgi:hypothetical protein
MKRRLLFALIGVLACSGDNANTPHAGSLTLTLASGGPSDGALLLLVSGGPITGVTSPAGYEIGSTTDARGTHIMVVGNVTAGAVGTITIPDVSRASAYVVTVEQVADRTSFGLLDPAAYRVTVGPMP